MCFASCHCPAVSKIQNTKYQIPNTKYKILAAIAAVKDLPKTPDAGAWPCPRYVYAADNKRN